MYNIFLNPSIAAIFFGIAAIFLFAQLKHINNKLLLVGTVLLLFLSATYIVHLNSRIVLVGVILVFGITTLIPFEIKLSKIYKLITIVIFLVLLLFVFLHKTNSTNGRLFIYKINTQIIREYWLTGINQPYSVVFNHTQANYFANNKLATLEQKMLAGNNYFVLNEWLNIFIHYGIIAFTLAVLLTIYLVTICIKQLKQFPQKSWAIGIVIFLLLVSLFSYPFSFIPYVFIFGGCILYIFKNTFALPQKINNRIFIILFIGLTTYSSYNIYTYTKAGKEKKEITDLFRVGYISQALNKALVVKNAQPPSQEVYKQIATIYLQKNNLDSAVFYIKQAHNVVCNDEIHNFWGQCLVLQNKPIEAIDQFLLAVNIIPHRFKNRFDLLKTYLLVSNFEQAKKCANEIINFPEKIPSKQSAFYKQQALVILDTVSN